MNLTHKIILYLRVFLKIRKNSSGKKEGTIEGIIFSKDRPMQLFSLLESYYKYLSPAPPLYIIYRSSDSNYEKAYEEVRDYFKNQTHLTFIKESDFRANLISLLKNIRSTYIFFLVDDIIFKSSLSFEDYLTLSDRDKYILSLRLGKNLSYCYPLDSHQELPHFKNKGIFLSWKWKKSQKDWKYVFSVDGNVYLKNEILAITEEIPFKAPNSYEASMNTLRYIIRRKDGLCYHESKLVNLCLNRVQDEVLNISGDISSEELLDLWNQGNKIDIDKFSSISNISAHIEVEQLPLKKR